MYNRTQKFSPGRPVLKQVYDLVRVILILLFDLIHCFNHDAIQKTHNSGKGRVGSSEKVTKSDIVWRGFSQK